MKSQLPYRCTEWLSADDIRSSSARRWRPHFFALLPDDLPFVAGLDSAGGGEVAGAPVAAADFSPPAALSPPAAAGAAPCDESFFAAALYESER